ncbi:hypothetical protein EVAR_48350_1 [Eumeta japonica]|uniref:Uncharacterized protein n=1 Tax=Eumeta variegata TaxID=151549 RepID=A0A4C1WMB2_EUMVA|nr:hypothetical protein EVAR_48350_1 [Eumeta japonica]
MGRITRRKSCSSRVGRLDGHKFDICKIVMFVFLINSIEYAVCRDISTNVTDYEEEVVDRGRSFFDNVYKNGSFDTGSVVWDNFLNQCTADPSVSCLQKNVYGIIDDGLGFNGDVNLLDGLRFKKNKVDVRKYTKEANVIYLTGSAGDDAKKDSVNENGDNVADNEVDDDEESGDEDVKCKLDECLKVSCRLSLSPKTPTSAKLFHHEKISLGPDLGPYAGDLSPGPHPGRVSIRQSTGRFRNETPLEEVTDALYDKGVQFLVTHDMRIRLPETFFHGTVLKISPRALTKTGALVHVDLEPKEEVNGQGRLFIFQKIKKQIKKKLFMAAIAIILVIKLIALKLVFVLPLIVGVTTAKKMLLKFLLFLFPALSHIFKLCSWYQQSYHTTKFHKHHHLITHHHHKTPHVYGPPHGHGVNSLVVTHPHHHEPAPTYDYNTPDWELSGPGLGSEYLSSAIHRNAIANFKPHVDDIHDINSWGLGMPPGPSTLNVGEYPTPGHDAPAAAPTAPNIVPYRGPYGARPVGPPANPYIRPKKITPLDPTEAEKEALAISPPPRELALQIATIASENGLLAAWAGMMDGVDIQTSEEKNPLWAVHAPGRTGCVRLARTENPLKHNTALPLARRGLARNRDSMMGLIMGLFYYQIRAASLAARVPPSPVRDELLRVSAARLTEVNRVQTETELVKQQQQILASQDPATIAAEKFYGGLLDRVNKILSPLGATETGCRERAICILYRDPFQHTPYSNLVSNELSKDSNELLAPADSKLALTYYRYVQAARDGQEEKDCLRVRCLRDVVENRCILSSYPFPVSDASAWPVDGPILHSRADLLTHQSGVQIVREW